MCAGYRPLPWWGAKGVRSSGLSDGYVPPGAPGGENRDEFPRCSKFSPVLGPVPARCTRGLKRPRVASGVLERPLAASDTPPNGILFYFQQFSAQLKKSINKFFEKIKHSQKKDKKTGWYYGCPAGCCLQTRFLVVMHTHRYFPCARNFFPCAQRYISPVLPSAPGGT